MNQHISMTFRSSLPWLISLISAAGLVACGGAGSGAASLGGGGNTLPVANVTPAYFLSPTTDTTPPIVGRKMYNINNRVLDADTSAMNPDDLNKLENDGTSLVMDHRHRDIRGRQRWNWNEGKGFRSAPIGGVTYTNTAYKPDDIRSLYTMPTMPTTATADLGAGQTVYIISAFHAPRVQSDLQQFITRFNLPTCTSTSVPASTTLPLVNSNTACQLKVAYATADGNLTDTAPNYDASWAMEATLDVSWVHATAPHATIVLIEAADSSLASMVGAIKLANKMGPGVVNMSFAVQEGAWVSDQESLFNTAGMSYVAASGDNGTQVNWPAVSTRVVAVGGTTLAWDGTNRTETGWAGSGGGISAYLALPTYQSGVAWGSNALTSRTVPDVAFNADPRSGQYVYFTNALGVGRWIIAGGTSLAAPQWAGILAINNARKGTVVKSSDVLARFYLNTLSSSFWDITTTSETSGRVCAYASCDPMTGFDLVTGVGSPKVSSLLGAL